MRFTREELSDAARVAIESLSDAKASLDELDELRLADVLGAELELHIACIPHPQDLPAFMCALLGLKTIATAECDEDLAGALRCLYGAAAELRRYRHPKRGELIRARPGEIEPWHRGPRKEKTIK